MPSQGFLTISLHGSVESGAEGCSSLAAKTQLSLCAGQTLSAQESLTYLKAAQNSTTITKRIDPATQPNQNELLHIACALSTVATGKTNRFNCALKPGSAHHWYNLQL